MSQVKIEVNNIKQLPVILGVVDVLKSAQLLPELHPMEKAAQGLYVRGGGPIKNLILLMKLLFIMHLIYLVSFLFLMLMLSKI